MDVLVSEIGKKAIGPYLVKIWIAVLFVNLRCVITKVYAILL